jgi:gamma-glutamyltranspeptidase/glutathione hydrolase
MPPAFTTRPEIVGTFGVVASTHWIATAVGMGVLERGGNAFDAAVATAFALQVVEPHLNGPLGEAPVIFHDTRVGSPRVICGQGVAPQAAAIERFADLGLDLIPGTGLLAACTPGAFDAWMILLRDHGTWSLADVLAPAIGYALRGFPLVERAVATIETVRDLFLSAWTSSAEVWLPGGSLPAVGGLFATPRLGETYARLLREAEAGGGGREAIIERARRAWSSGFVAEAVDRFGRGEPVLDVSGRRHRALLTGDDMARWQATVEAPIGFDHGRWRVLKPDLWTQGAALLQQLALLAPYDLDRLDPTGPDFVHLQVEAAKLAFADRDTFYGDPAFVASPLETLLSKDYNDARRALIGETASLELRPGTIPGHGKAVTSREAVGAAGGGGAGEPTVGRLGEARGDTVHFDIVDAAGNMVSATPSGGWLQSSPVIPDLGFPLGTRAQMFWLDPDHPAALAPGKRPRSTLTPALHDGEPRLAWGSPGGDQQDQWNTQFFLRHAHAGHDLQQAIDAPAWHSEHFPSSFWPREARPGVLVVEGRLPAATIAELRRRGHRVEVGGGWSEGRLTAAARDGSLRRAAANPRGMQGYAAGR